MSEPLAELLLRARGQGDCRVLGVVTGIVTNNDDPDNLGRVKVKFPWLSDTDESWWARIAVPMAGKSRGTYFLPEVNDEVLVAFEHGDVGFPYVLGALWNSNSPPPETNDDQKNNHRSITSRSGHVVRLDDTENAEKIEIVDKSGKNKIVLDITNNAITITADSDVTVSSTNGKLKLSGNGIEISSKADVTVEAESELKLSATGQTNVKGAVINLN